MFYLALFLYEDEEGVWQNRIENVWMTVYERAQATDSVTVALFNRIGQILNTGFSSVFGERLLSFRSFAISINLSLAGGCIFVLLLNYWSLKKGISATPPQGVGALLLLTLLFFFLAFMPVILGEKRWVSVLSVVPISFILFTALYMFHQLILNPGYQAQPLILLLSFISDYTGIMVLRRLFVSISTTRSTIRFVSTILTLIVFSFLIWICPSAAVGWVGKYHPGAISLRVAVLSIELTFFNFTTALLCLIPAVMLIFLLFHNLMWPTLGRIIYPLCRYKIVTNRTVLISLGSLCATYTLNLEHIGAKELLKLLS